MVYLFSLLLNFFWYSFAYPKGWPGSVNMDGRPDRSFLTTGRACHIGQCFISSARSCPDRWVRPLRHAHFPCFLGMWQSPNLTTFELHMFSPDSKLDKCFKRFVVECEFVGKSLFYDWFRVLQPASADKPVFFSYSTYHTNYSNIMNEQHSICSVMCYTVLIWTLNLLTLGNNIV